MGTDTIIDLTETRDNLRDYQDLLRTLPNGRFVKLLRAPIADVGVTEPARIHFILDVIEAALDAQQRVDPHCWGGAGRTGMIAGCLMVRRGMSSDAALAEVASGWKSMPKSKLPHHKNRTSPETDAQKDVVRKWADHEATRRARRGESARITSAVANDHSRDTPSAPTFDAACAAACWAAPLVTRSASQSSSSRTQRSRRIHGPGGVRELALDMNLGAAPISDDTQMTLFTAEGMLRGINRGNHRGVGGPSSCMTKRTCAGS